MPERSLELSQLPFWDAPESKMGGFLRMGNDLYLERAKRGAGCHLPDYAKGSTRVRARHSLI